MKWRWLVGAGVALLIFLLIRSVSKPNQPKLHEIRWQANAPIAYTLPCDLDGDGRDEVVVETANGEYWWLKPSLNGWKATLMPVKGIHFIRYHYAASLHRGILGWDKNKALCFLHYRNGWRWQKLLDAPVQDFKWLDLDGDGKVNDVLVLKKGWVWWFKIGDDGRVIAQDRQRISGRRLSPSPLKVGFGFWSEKGKLVISHDWIRLDAPQLDWDGDGVPEIVHYNTISGDTKLLVHFSHTGEKRRIHLANSLIFALHGKRAVTADLEGKGKRELAIIAQGRIILIDEQGQWRPTPCKPVSVRGLWVTRRGEKDWIWVETPEKLWLLYHDGKGYQVRQWKFERDPLAVWIWQGERVTVWQDKQGVWFAFCSKWSLDSHPFGRWVVKASNWLQSLGISIRIQRERTTFHLWKWDEHQNDWKQIKRTLIPTRLDYVYFLLKPLDLNGDGQSELVMMLPGEIGLFTGRWHFISGNQSWISILRDGERKWIVSKDDKDQKVLWGLTLTDFDVKSSGGR